MRRSYALTLAAVCLLAGGVAGFWWRGAPDGAALPPRLTPLEVGFAQDMSAHHVQAVELCNVLAAKPVDDVLRALCAQIQTAQNQEIGVMSGWLMLLDEPQSSSAPMVWMGHGHDSGHHGTARMPGMASRAEIDELGRLVGRDREVLFLQLMHRHHQGGLEMAAYAAERAQTRAVAQLATLMVADQGEESGVIEQLLRARGAEPLPAG